MQIIIIKYNKKYKSLQKSKKEQKKISDVLFLLITIFGSEVLDFCVRDGNRYFHFDIITNKILRNYSLKT